MKAPTINATTTTAPITPQVHVGTPEDASESVVVDPSSGLVVSCALLNWIESDDPEANISYNINR